MSATIRFRPVIGLCVVVFLVAIPGSMAADVRAWFDLQSGKAVGETLTARVAMGARWEDDASFLASHFATFGLQSRRSSWFTLAGYYRWQEDHAQLEDVDLPAIISG